MKIISTMKIGQRLLLRLKSVETPPSGPPPASTARPRSHPQDPDGKSKVLLSPGRGKCRQNIYYESFCKQNMSK